MTAIELPAKSSFSSPAVKPLPFKFAWLYFAIPAVVVAFSVYWGIPALVNLGLAQFTAYSIALLIPLIFMLAAALIAYRLEGHPLTWNALSERFRLRRMTGKDWLWTLGGLLVGYIGMSITLALAKSLVRMNLIPLPAYIPPILDPNMPSSDPIAMLAIFRDLMGPDAVGNWWLVVLSAALLFFNIIGEEFWWRGYILPRQELSHGRWTWLFHGIMWCLFHAFKYWDWLGLLPVCLVISFIAQRRQNTWPGVVIHLLVNSMTLIPVLMVVMGLAK